MPERFTWRDGERLIRFGGGVAAEARELLAGNGFRDFHLLTTARALRSVPALAAGAARVSEVPAGRVDELSGELVRQLDGEQHEVVALGGGRVVDCGKAVAGATGARCAALPTTLSGAELTPFHRLPHGIEGAGMVRPALVVADPELMAAAPSTQLAASAMNALAHAMEALYTPLANPVCDLAALRAATLLSDGLSGDPPGREELALGALLAGYSSGCTGIAVHHALCQSIVRTAGSPHAETNAVMLPHTARLMAPRAPGALGELAGALGDPSGDPASTPGALARLAARCGHVRLATVGVSDEHLAPAVAATLEHPALANTPEPPGEDELIAVLRAALTQ